MPNWCHDVLTVSGPAEEIAAFAGKARGAEGRPLSFEPFVHSPSLGSASEENSWAVDHWGTKWDAQFQTGAILVQEDVDPTESLKTMGVVVTTETLVYKFITAWSPPLAAVAAMSEQHPELDFTLRYAEYGEGFAGEVQLKAGIVTSQVDLVPEETFAPEEAWF